MKKCLIAQKSVLKELKNYKNLGFILVGVSFQQSRPKYCLHSLTVIEPLFLLFSSIFQKIRNWVQPSCKSKFGV